MYLFDLHCDTLYKSVTNNIPLDDSQMDVQPFCFNNNSHILQCYAIWLPDDLSEEIAEQSFFRACKTLRSECNRLGIILADDNSNIINLYNLNRNSAIFTVENASALNNKLENIRRFSELGVRIMTLTWNGSNSVGDGADIINPVGLTDFGRKAVAEMEKYSIVVDVSHASDKLFYDVAETATRPFIATHSNSRTITSHRRNLTDEQFEIIKNAGGIVGLNFYKGFLSDAPEDANMYDILRHTEQFLSLGGENTVCIGSDFDGCDLPKDINGSSSMDEIYEMFLKHNYKESVIKKIFYENALKFFENFDKARIM